MKLVVKRKKIVFSYYLTYLITKLSQLSQTDFNVQNSGIQKIIFVFS